MSSRWNVSYPQVVLIVLLSALLIGVVGGLSTSGAAYDPYNYDWDGGNDLRTTLDSDATEANVVLDTRAYSGTVPAETAAIVIEPRERYGPTDRSRLSSFVSQGGTLIVASGSNTSTSLLSNLGSTVEINGTRVLDEQNNVRDSALPRATNVSSDDRVRDIDSLTLNNGTVLELGRAKPLINTSTFAYLDQNGNKELDSNEPLGRQPVTAVEKVGAGEIIVVSDGSVFTNAMLEEEGNRQFVRNIRDDYDQVLLDYSQRGALPPVIYLLLTLRASQLLQIIAGLSGLGVIALWGRVGVWERFGAGWQLLTQSDAEQPDTAPIDSETLSSYLANQHPEWDQSRVERVTKATIHQQQQGEDNE